MSNTSKIILNEATDDFVVAILQRILPLLEAAGVSYFVVGALARDLGLWARGFREAPSRKSNDIDIAIMVGSMQDYEALMAQLEALPDFELHGELPYRLMFMGRYEVDILPFEAVYLEQGEIEIRGKKTFVLNIQGFQEVSPWVEAFETTEGFTLNVSSLSGVVLLKLIAWDDNQKRDKDIQDIYHILKHFYLLSTEEIMESDDDILELCQHAKYYDEAISSRFIGRQIGRILKDSPMLKQRLLTILSNSAKTAAMSKLMEFATLDDAEEVIAALHAGIIDAENANTK